MKKLMQKIVALFCLMIALLVPCQTVLASEVEDDYEAMPLMTYIADYTIDFGISGGKAIVGAEVDGDVEYATRAKVIAELQVKSGSNWIPVAIWTEDSYDYYARIDETHDVVKGHTYRVKGTFMVWEGSAYETEYSFSDEITA